MGALRDPVEVPQPIHAAELQGLYGPFVFPEKLLQKIWLRRDFDLERAYTAGGQRIRVLHPGRWNLLGGPDFKSARLRFDDGPEIEGDVELHIESSDWDAHGHARDPAYDRVVLHVVLFPPGEEKDSKGARGPIPVLPLLTILLHDLEEYAAEEAVENLAQRPASQIVERLGALQPPELLGLMRRHAEARWNQKVHFAQLRIQRLGWREACHVTALEILGYRFNRAPMLRVATRWPLKDWLGADLSPESVFEAERPAWSLQGIRPANHPLARLRQYARWVGSSGEWPDKAREIARQLPRFPPLSATAEVRKQGRLAQWRRLWADKVFGESLSGTRIDTLICDGCLPLHAAAGEAGLDGVWTHWFCGDLPPMIVDALRTLAVFEPRRNPACNGIAQGLLGWLLDQERREAGPAGRGA